MPIEVDEKEFGMSRDRLYVELKKFNIHARRYFYPLVTDFACYQSIIPKDPLTVAKGVAERILTLPTYYELTLGNADIISDFIANIRDYHTYKSKNY